MTQWAILFSVLLAFSAPVNLQAAGGAQIKVEHIGNDAATPEFPFHELPRPVHGDAAASAVFTVIAGAADHNSGGLEKLNDGGLPLGEDEPGENFFLGGTSGGRLLVDLREEIELERICTYSWHPAGRAPQVYKLYGYGKPGRSFDPKSAATGELSAEWGMLAGVDTRVPNEATGGQCGVVLDFGSQAVRKVRYLLFDIQPAIAGDANSNTFFSEIDIVTPAAAASTVPAKAGDEVYEAAGGKFHIYLKIRETPELAEWVHQRLMPAVQEWYPRVATLLPSEGFTPPAYLSITFQRKMNGVAYTKGRAITCAYPWYEKNLQGDAVGSVVHELVHVAQQFRGGGPPGWLVEGIPDYIRWYLFEPERHGADIPAADIPKVKYDDGYRSSANFLHWITQHYDRDLIRKLNAAMRRGEYSDGLWSRWCGKTLPELGAEWKASLAAGTGKR